MTEKIGKTVKDKIWLQRLCWLLLGGAVVFAAVQYLRVTQLKPLGGDDQCNIPAMYYQLTHTPTLQYIWDQYKDIFLQFPFRYGRFFPLGSVPRYIRVLSYGSVASYRMYMILYTLATAAVISLLLVRITGSRAFGMSYLALVPMIFCLWNNHELNGLYSYATTALCPLLMFALASHAMVSWGRKRKWYWAVLTGALTFWGCAAYEVGYVYIFAMGFLALLLNDKFLDSVRTGLPALAGELTALALYAGNLIASLQRSGGIYPGLIVDTTDKSRVLLAWVQQMSGAFPLNQPLLGHARRSIPYVVSDWIWPLLLALAVALCLLLGRVKLNRKQAACLFCAGLCMLVFPALLVALSGKYNSDNGWWVSWTRAYIPATNESFGVGLMAVVGWTVVLQGLSRPRLGRLLCWFSAVIVVFGLVKCSAWQRLLVREEAETYPALDRYEFLARSLENGMVDGVSEKDTLLCDYNVWGGDTGAERAFFRRYTERELDAYYTESWRNDPAVTEGELWRMGYCRGHNGCGGVWLAKTETKDAEYGGNVLLYLDGDYVSGDAEIRYTVADGGKESEESVKLARLDRSAANGDNEYFAELPVASAQLSSLSLVEPEQ